MDVEGRAAKLRQGGEQRRAGGGGQLSRSLVDRVVGRDGRVGRGDELQGGRRRIGVTPGPAGRGRGSQDERRRVHRFDPKVVEGDGRPHHVHQSVDAAQLLQFNRVPADAVHPAFGLPQSIQDDCRAFDYLGRQLAGRYRLQEFLRRKAGSVIQVDLQVSAANLATGLLLGGDAEPAGFQPAQLFA